MQITTHDGEDGDSGQPDGEDDDGCGPTTQLATHYGEDDEDDDGCGPTAVVGV